MKLIVLFLILHITKSLASDIPVCIFSAPPEGYKVRIIRKDIVCCEAMTKECLDCKKLINKGVPIENYSSIYPCDNDKYPIDSNGVQLSMTNIDFDIKCSKNYDHDNQVQPDLISSCVSGNYGYTYCNEPSCISVTETESDNGVLTKKPSHDTNNGNNVCIIEKCKEGYYLVIDLKMSV